jgi:hypothetical protein
VIETLVGCVAWVMAILLDYFEVIFEEMCEWSKTLIKA